MKEDIFDFNQKLSSMGKFTAKAGGKFIKVFPDEEKDVAVAELLKANKWGVYRKCLSDQGGDQRPPLSVSTGPYSR